MYMYISRPGKGSRVISRSRVSSDRNAAEVVLVRVAELGVEMHARIHIYICIKWPRSIYQPQTVRTFRVCYTTRNVHNIYYNV